MSTARKCQGCGKRADLRKLGSRMLCGPCARAAETQRQAAGPLTSASALRGLVDLFKQVGGPISALWFGATLPLAIVCTQVDPESLLLVNQLYGLIVGVAIAGAVVHIAVAHLQGEEWSMVRSIGTGYSNFLGLFATDLIWGLVVIFSLGIRWMSMHLRLPLIMSGEAWGVDSLGKSAAMMKGHRLKLAPAFILVAIPSLAGFALLFWPDPEPLLTGLMPLAASALGLPALLLPAVVWARLREQESDEDPP